MRRAAPWMLALAIGAAGGWAAYAIELPLAWMIGAMGATTVAATLGLPITLPTGLRSVMVAVLGLMLGSGFSPALLDRFDEWAISLSAVAAYTAVAGGIGLLYFRRIAGYDPVTAYFSAMPGGLSEMILVGSEMGGDVRVISLTHGFRILLVVLTVPFAFQLLLDFEPAARPPPGLPIGVLPAQDLLLLAACGIAGFLGARSLAIPAAAVVGPMLLSAIVHLAGWTAASPPRELVAAAQVIVGAAVGCRFAGVALSLIGRSIIVASGGTVLLMAVTVTFAVALHRATGFATEALVLAFAPGGLAEMSLIALALGADAAFVATHHIARIFLIVVCAPLAYRITTRARRNRR